MSKLLLKNSKNKQVLTDLTIKNGKFVVSNYGHNKIEEIPDVPDVPVEPPYIPVPGVNFLGLYVLNTNNTFTFISNDQTENIINTVTYSGASSTIDSFTLNLKNTIDSNRKFIVLNAEVNSSVTYNNTKSFYQFYNSGLGATQLYVKFRDNTRTKIAVMIFEIVEDINTFTAAFTPGLYVYESKIGPNIINASWNYEGRYPGLEHLLYFFDDVQLAELPTNFSDTDSAVGQYYSDIDTVRTADANINFTATDRYYFRFLMKVQKILDNHNLNIHNDSSLKLKGDCFIKYDYTNGVIAHSSHFTGNFQVIDNFNIRFYLNENISLKNLIVQLISNNPAYSNNTSKFLIYNDSIVVNSSLTSLQKAGNGIVVFSLDL